MIGNELRKDREMLYISVCALNFVIYSCVIRLSQSVSVYPLFSYLMLHLLPDPRWVYTIVIFEVCVWL